MIEVRDEELVAALRAGDEQAFASIVDAFGPQMLRVATLYTPSRSAAEDAVQDAWLAVLHGIDGFEARSSLKTWIFRILMNRAITRGTRERRAVPFSSAWDPDADGRAEPAVSLDRFQDDTGRYPGHWAVPPRPWDEIPEARLASNETFDVVRAALSRLPPSQRTVVTLRDIEGWSSAEVCNAFGLSETNQRVLLHRGRSGVRRALEAYIDASREET